MYEPPHKRDSMINLIQSKDPLCFKIFRNSDIYLYINNYGKADVMNDFSNKLPIELYYWPTSNGFKISIFLEEAKYPYNLNYVNISKREQFEPSFLKISPNNRMPAIIDPDGPDGKEISIFFESGAILQYLGRKTEMFYP